MNTFVPLDEIQAWRDIVTCACNALGNETMFCSPVQEQRYQVAKVSSSKISIKRLDASTPETLSSKKVKQAVKKLNDAKGQLKRGDLNHEVAKETAIVYLHPRLKYDNAKHWIEVTAPCPQGGGPKAAKTGCS